MQSSNDPRPCARACSTPKKLWYVKSTLTSAQEHSFKLHVRPWAYLYNCGRPSLIQAFFVWWLRFCILSSLGTTSQLSTEWCQSLPKQSELPHKDYYEAKNLSLSNTGKDHKTSIGDNLIWLQTFVISSSDQSLQLSTQALQQRVVRTEYHLRWRPWLQVNVNIVLTYILFSCLIISWRAISFDIFYSSVWLFLDSQGSRKLPPAWEEREEYDSLAPLPVIPRWDNRSNLVVILGRKGWQLVLKVLSTPYCLLILWQIEVYSVFPRVRTIRRPVGVGSLGTSSVRSQSLPQEIRDGKVDLTRELVGKMDVTRQRIRAQQLTKQVSFFFCKTFISFIFT